MVATLGGSSITVELPLVFPSLPAKVALQPEQTEVELDREIAIGATVHDASGAPVPASGR